MFSGDIDPEIASLLEGDSLSRPAQSRPDFTDLFEDSPSPDSPTSHKKKGKGVQENPGLTDISRKVLPEIPRFEQSPQPYFQDKNFYQNILKGEGDAAKKLHTLLAQLLNAKDSETRTNTRLRIIPVYWEVMSSLSAYTGSRSIPMEKKLCLRYGILLPSLISPEQRQILCSIIMDGDTYGEPVHYMDEWLRLVSRQETSPLATDEVRTIKKNEKTALTQRVEKVQGQRDGHISIIQNKLADMNRLEANIVQLAQNIGQHDRNSRYPQLLNTLSAHQRQSISDLGDSIKQLQNLDRELTGLFRDLERIDETLSPLKDKAEAYGDDGESDSQLAAGEVSSLRQMVKLSAGRQGNHFPIAMKQYMPQRIEDVATRENVIKIMAEVERLDPGLFLRSFKNNTNRIVPHVILLPCFGDYGLCWEPFEKFNKATSRGRIGIPLYPKNLKLAVTYALADLRWQVAKEKAQHYWMEEGITGKYYQWFSDRKLKGDVRHYFIQDYILWITKESEGTQKMDKEVRGIFWRNIPYPQEVRDILRNRGFVYNELYKKDQNRAMSDGY